MNPFSKLGLPELHKLKKDTISKCREAKAQKNKSFAIKLKKDVGMIRQCIASAMSKLPPKEVAPGYQEILQKKEESNLRAMSDFGFIITSHALKRYRLRFNPDISMDELYKMMASTEIIKYVGIFGSGQFPVTDNCVAVIKHKKILTFKDPTKITNISE